MQVDLLITEPQSGSTADFDNGHAEDLGVEPGGLADVGDCQNQMVNPLDPHMTSPL